MNTINTTNPDLMEELYNYFNYNNQNFYKNMKLYSNYYYCLKEKNELQEKYSNFITNFYFKIVNLENSNYQEFYYLLNTIYYKIENYFNPDIFNYSEA